MGKLIASEWITLDGIFDGDTLDQWFMPFDSLERQTVIQQETLNADAGIMGRVTYEMLEGYWAPLKNNEMGIADKLNSMPKYVVSTTLKEAKWANTKIINENVIDQIRKIKDDYEGIVKINGSARLVQSLLDNGLIDELHLMIQPIIFRKGKQFYINDLQTRGMKLIQNQTLPHGVVLLIYQP